MTFTDLTHGNQGRALDARLVEFPGLTHVEQQRLAIRVAQVGIQLTGTKLTHVQNRNASGCGALTSGGMAISNRLSSFHS